MKKAWVLMVALSPGVAGCAGSGSDRGSWSSGIPFWSRGEQGIPATPDYSQGYGQGQNEIGADRGEVLDRSAEMPKPQEKGRFARMTAAVTGSSAVKSVTSVFNKKDVAVRGAPAVEKIEPTEKPIGPGLNVKFAQAHEQNGNLPGAAEQYERALKADPKLLEALLGYARLEDRRGNFEAATKLYERATEAHPQEAVALNDLALCLSRQKRTHDAITAMTQAITLRPDRKLYRNNMAKLLVDIGQSDKALEHLRSAHPPAAAHYNLAYLLHQRGDNAGAAAHFALALEIDPSLAEARQWLDALGQPAVQPATPEAANGPQLNYPQPAANHDAQRQAPSAGALPMVLRPESDPAREPRYGMDPFSGYAPPRRY